MPVYVFEHPETKEVFEEFRSFKKINKPFYAPDGIKCKRILFPGKLSISKKRKEFFEQDPEYVKKVKPKYVRFRDGHRERYDETKHC